MAVSIRTIILDNNFLRFGTESSFFSKHSAAIEIRQSSLKPFENINLFTRLNNDSKLNLHRIKIKDIQAIYNIID